MNLIILVYLALGIWPNVSAMYYLEKKEVFQPTNRTLRNNSYFGYSVTYDELNEKLVISAPRENNIGEVYTCPIENRTCTPINNTNIVKRLFENYTHDYWFGATVKAGQDFVMICAPRYTVLFEPSGSKGKNIQATHGRCYSYTELGGLKERLPISEKDRLRDFPVIYNKDKTMDSFGWSIEVTPKNSILVGGPGMYHGRTMIYEGTEVAEVPKLYSIGESRLSPAPKYNFDKTMDSFGWSIEVTPKNSILVGGPGMYHGRTMIYEGTEVAEVPKLYSIGESRLSPAPKYNFGYAIASGMFINNKLSYAISSTYGTKGKGKIQFYIGMRFIKYIDDTSHIGSMFGGVLCAAKLLGDRTDLLVGAPVYATKDTYNLGAVYVYLSRTMFQAPEFHRRIVGKVSGSMFGSAIINVGDLNGDDIDELAISAPFENYGVVYLYSGADLININIEKDLKYLQRIEAEKGYGESFGMSLSPLLDYDKNGCKELAIGSPYINTVVLLRCMAAVIVKTSNPKFFILEVRNSSQNEFEFEVCLTVKYPTLPQKIIAVLSTTVEIMHDKLLLTNGSAVFTYETSLDEKKPKYCKNITLFFSEDGIYEAKVSYTVSSKLLNNPATLPDFNSSRVILSDLSVLTINGSVWADECAACVPNLTLTPFISFRYSRDEDTYIIGSSKNETVRVTVHNVGDVAYEPCVRVHIIGANVLMTPTGCVHENLADQNRLVCKPPMPIRTNKSWTTGQIVLEMTHLTNLDKNIIINMLRFDRCEDVLSENVSIPVPLKADPRGISIKGEADIGSIVNMTKEDIETNWKLIQHIYMITNKGPTNWKKLKVLVNLQTKPYIKYTPVLLHYSTSNLYFGCPFLRQNETSKSYVCLIESLVKKVDVVKILIPMFIIPGTLDGILEKDKNVTIVTSSKFIDDDSKVERIPITAEDLFRDCFVGDDIITTITLQEPMEVPIETIIIGGVVGLCILIIIALILYRVGFLRRKKREELKNLKMKVKRQTILRRSTMASQAPQAEDRSETLEGIKEENESDHTQQELKTSIVPIYPSITLRQE